MEYNWNEIIRAVYKIHAPMKLEEHLYNMKILQRNREGDTAKCLHCKPCDPSHGLCFSLSGLGGKVLLLLPIKLENPEGEESELQSR